MKNFIKVHKDSLPTFDSMDVIYKLNCINCDASYVGLVGNYAPESTNTIVMLDATLTLNRLLLTIE